MLYLLHQLADSPDPNLPDPVAFSEFQHEEARRQRRRDREEYGSLRSSDRDAENELPLDPMTGAYRPTDLRDVLKNPKEVRSPDEESPYSDPRRPPSPSEWKRNKSQVDESPSLAKRDVSIKSKLLADNYSSIEPPEPTILRDLPYTLQGVSSATLPFGPDYSLKLPSSLPPPLIGLLHTLAEPSLLCKALQDFVKTPAKGLLDQSLRAAINDELRSYLTLVAT